MNNEEKFIAISLNAEQAYFLKGSLDLLLGALASMDYTDQLFKYSRSVKPLIGILDNVHFTSEHLKCITVEIDEITAEAICHSMYSMIQTLFGVGDSVTYEKLKDIQKSIWEQIYNKFETSDMNIYGESDPNLECWR